jgi:hypothetical protein
MWCVPKCRACIVAGTCEHETQVPATPIPTVPKPRRRAAVQATYPHDVNPTYTHLVCGHVTHKEAILFYSVWQTDKNKLWCETCGRWTKIVKEPKPEPLTADTLF